jgi:hypothetical protein
LAAAKSTNKVFATPESQAAFVGPYPATAKRVFASKEINQYKHALIPQQVRLTNYRNQGAAAHSSQLATFDVRSVTTPTRDSPEHETVSFTV